MHNLHQCASTQEKLNPDKKDMSAGFKNAGLVSSGPILDLALRNSHL